MGAASSTCSPSNTQEAKYDVFLSFAGKDSDSDGFKSHLCGALSEKHIETFIDNDGVHKRGDELSPTLLRAVRVSEISLVIFSSDYAFSKACLRELAEIIKQKKMNKLIVIPVFYRVDPSAVRKQTGSFKDAFDKHKQVSREELQTWRQALTEASNVSGWDSSVTRPESRLIDEIVKDVLKKLNDMFAATDLRGLVGIDSRIQEVKSLLCMETLDFRVLGIWGMGGIGKTTLAGAVFNQISCRFDGCCCFVANVREESENCGGLVHLRDKLISQILGEEVHFGTPHIPPLIRRSLQSKKVFIVLDDVYSLKQLETLAGGLDRFMPGSRILITTRDKQLLQKFVVTSNIYEVKALENREALQLFCNSAFKEDLIPKDLMLYAKRAVTYGEGNPLALKVLGSSLYGKSEEDWEDALRKLNKIPKPEIHNILRIGYDALDREEKSILLDIGCFFKGEYMQHVIELLNSCYFSVQAGLSVLVDKSLVVVSATKINMHDLLQEMCWEIVRQESLNNPGERSRLHGHEDVCRVLRRNTGTESVKSILLDMSQIKNLDLNSQAFENMSNLRYLKLYDWTRRFGDPTNISKVHLRSGLNSLPDALRYLSWHGYPSRVLPLNLSLDNLVELDLFDSNVEHLWDGKKNIPRLKRLILGHSQQLTSIPDLSGSPDLEVLDLVDCKNLLDISSSIQHLDKLNYLRLEGCRNLRSFSNDVHFKSLKNFDLSSCFNLTKFPQLSGNIEILSFKGSKIEEVPSSIENLTNLLVFELTDCSRLTRISTNICRVKSLRFLILKNCSNLENFPEILETMECLESLDLSGTAIKELPFSIENLTGLSKLLLRACKNLERLPNSIGKIASLLEFDLTDCLKLENSPVQMENLSAGRSVESSLLSSSTPVMSVIDCLAFRPLSGLSSSLKDLCLNNCNLTEISEDIGCISSLKTLELCGNDFQTLPTSIKQLTKLEVLFLNHCNLLRSVTVLPLNLLVFEAMNCRELQSLPETSQFIELITSERINKRASRLTRLDFVFTNSPKLDEKTFGNVFLKSVERIRHMAASGKIYQNEVHISISYPGSNIPVWFSNQSSGSSLNIEMLPVDSSGIKFLGFALCLVVAFKRYHYKGNFSVDVPYECCLRTDHGDLVTYHGKLTVAAERNHNDSILIDSDHVLLGYDDYSRVKMSVNNFTACKVTFKTPADSSPNIPLRNFSQIEDIFGVTISRQICKLKHCGVCPIYAEPEIVQTSISDERLDSDDQAWVPDCMETQETKPEIEPCVGSLLCQVGLCLSNFWILFACLFCVVGILVQLML